ncbi:hypothetical protein HK105_204791 [Polyrhizophydium stewartii]|uniref:Uncharacterized protein n=1 Tax=Polyrhizophydium stewartii TaxID=2732419 RepID=A0ABR4N7V8_9FUNG
MSRGEAMSSSTQPGDWTALGNVARAFYEAYEHVQKARSITGSAKHTDRAELRLLAANFTALEATLFPWLGSASSLDRAASAAGRGIAITTGTKYALVAKLAITAIRRLGSPLPIEVFFCGDDDLAAAERAMLAALPGVAVVDMRTRLAITDCQRSWGNKPFAALASSFREVILMDADTMFVQPPDVLFGMRGYADTGALLFRDRTLPFGTNGYWGHDLVAVLEQIAAPFAGNMLLRDNRPLSRKGSEEIDSGVVVWDKARVMPVVLLTCLLNAPPFTVSKLARLHGDKETFLIAHEALHVPFATGPSFGSAIGQLTLREPNRPRVCGPLLHVDADASPVWINGGLGKRIPSVNPEVVWPEYLAIDDRGYDLDWDHSRALICLVAGENGIVEGKPAARLVRVSGNAKSMLDWMAAEWIETFQIKHEPQNVVPVVAGSAPEGGNQ